MPEVIVGRGTRQRVVESPLPPLAINSKVTITGNIEFDGPIEIDGFVTGEVRCATVNISRTGTVSGMIVARSVTVSGGVSGSIFAEQLVLKPESDVEGEICYRELALEGGSFFEGRSRPHQNPLEQAELQEERRVPLKVVEA